MSARNIFVNKRNILSQKYIVMLRFVEALLIGFRDRADFIL